MRWNDIAPTVNTVLTHDIENSQQFSCCDIILCGVGYNLYLRTGLPIIYFSYFMIIVVFFLFFSAAAQIIAQSRAVVEFNQARSHEDQIQKCYRAIAEGAKELRLHRKRRYNIYNLKLKPIIQEIYGKQIRAVNCTCPPARSIPLHIFRVGIVLLARDSSWLNIDLATSAGFYNYIALFERAI